jgi:hypothetical protein
MLTVLKIGLWSCSNFTSCKLHSWKTMNRFKTFISIKANQIRTLESWPFDSLRQLKITARATHAAITRQQVAFYRLHALWSDWALFRCLSSKNTLMTTRSFPTTSVEAKLWRPQWVKSEFISRNVWGLYMMTSLWGDCDKKTRIMLCATRGPPLLDS